MVAILHLDRSDSNALCLEREDGTQVSIEDALRDGFQIDPNDTPRVLTLIIQDIFTRDRTQK